MFSKVDSVKGAEKKRLVEKLGKVLASLSLIGMFSAAVAVNIARAEDGLTKFSEFFDSDRSKAAEKAVHQIVSEQVPSDRAPSRERPAAVMFSSDPSSHLTAPDARAAMRINPEAPGPFIGLASAYFQGDMPVAKQYARQFVTYLSDLMFSVKDITQLIGEAMIEQGSINEEDWVGVGQYLDYELAQARTATDSPIKPTHEEALKHIQADPKGEVEVYYFFTLNSSFARKMAPDVERLWQSVKRDSRVKMVALTLGPTPKEWLASYRQYTGLSLPIFDGENVAKQLQVAFVPAVVIVSPNLKTAYVKTGQQEFKRLYEFVRTAQGESTQLSKDAQQLMGKKIGKAEKAMPEKSSLITASSPRVSSGGLERISSQDESSVHTSLEKF